MLHMRTTNSGARWTGVFYFPADSKEEEENIQLITKAYTFY